MKDKAQANKTAQELEEIRKNRIKQAAKGSQNKSEEQTKDSQDTENQEKSEEKLDNDQNNSYINKEDSQESGEKQSESPDNKSKEEQLDEYEKVLNETFGGDPKKAVKSWKESQKNYTKLRQKTKEAEQKLSTIENLVEKNPFIGDILKEANQKGELKQEDLQNFIGSSDKEPQGKPDSPSESKLEIVDNDVSDINEETLVEEGYLNPDQKDSFSSEDWNLLKRQAAIKYTEDNLPKKIGKQAVQYFQQQIEAEKEKRQQEKELENNREVNSQRYQDGIERVIDEYDLDFAGNEQHQELLDDIEELASNIRDPQNRNVIHPNAIYLATTQVLQEKDVQVGKSQDVDQQVDQAEQNVEESLNDKMGFNKKTRQTSKDSEPKTLAEKLRQRRLDDYKQELEYRKKTNRLTPDG
jgi:hypothetical protein